MKKIKYLMFFALTGVYNFTFADGGIFTGISGGTSADDVTKLKEGKFTIDDIPNILQLVTNYLMGLAGTISVIFIILGAYQMMMGSISGEKTKGKNTVTLAASGFVLSALSWVILKTIIDNFAL